MPRFHCNVYDGADRPDLVGVELPDLETARLEAIRLAGSILREEAQRVARGDDWRIEVTDSAGTALFRMTFKVDDFPTARETDRSGVLAAIRTRRPRPLAPHA